MKNEKINLDGGKYLAKGRGYNYLQNQYKWLPKMPTQKNYTHPWNGKPTYFNYDQKMKDVLGEMVPYVCICKMLRVGMFATHTQEFLEDFYSDLVSDTYLKINKSIHNWNLKYDILRYVQCMVNWSWLSLWTLYKEEKKTIKGILDPQLSLSYKDSLELFLTYTERGEDELCEKLMNAQMEQEKDEAEDIDNLVE